jgi:hypothetical protein
MDSSIPNPAAPAAGASSTDEKLDVLIGLLSGQAAARVPAPVDVAAVPRPSAGIAATAAPVRPDPEPEPPKAAPAPHAGETFEPGQLGYYSYHRNGDPEGVDRTQVVAVVATTADHVHGLVLGDAADVASFAQGQLTATPPANLA